MKAIALTALIPIVFAACGTRVDDNSARVLLFAGTGTSPGDVAAIEQILRAQQLDYSTVNSSQIGAMSIPQIRRHRLLIVPGGNFEKIGKGMTPHAASHIRQAVWDGMNYLGICAGAFFAGDSPYNGLNLTSGVRFGFYSAENRGIRKAVVAIDAAGGPTLDQYWEDGPELSGWGSVVAKYPDGTPAVVEGAARNGWVILSGIHPEAPESWRSGMNFTTPVETDNAYAAALIRAGLNRETLPHY